MPKIEEGKILNKVHEKYKNILNNCPIAVLEINSNTEEISYFNKRFLNISGYNAEYLANKPIKKIIFEED